MCLAASLSVTLAQTNSGLSDTGGVACAAIRTEPVDLGGGISMELVLLPAGELLMGSSAKESGRYNDEIQHKVVLGKPFWIGRHEVTQEQWLRVMGSSPSFFKGASNPVERVSWPDCQEFVQRLNKRVAGGGFRLPTEVEWEYACRARTVTRYHGGDKDNELAAEAWFSENSGATTHPVGVKNANAFGLHDMHGNVLEWCQDWVGDYPTGTVVNATGPISGKERVFRGGCWSFPAVFCRSAIRFGREPEVRWNNLGFRVARTQP
jgi:formylglycine-generating enzyme required for sulfatase activity